MKLVRTRAGDDSVRLGARRIRDILRPLSLRERFVYGAIFAVLAFIIFGPLASASNADIGSTFVIPANNCTSDETWTNPENASGSSQVPYSSPPSELSILNSTYASSTSSALICSSYSRTKDHVITKPTVELSIAAIHQLPSEASTIAPPTLYETVKVDSRDALEPNILGGETEVSIDGLLEISISADSGKTWTPLHLIDNGLFSESTNQVSIALPEAFTKDLSKLQISAQLVSSTQEQFVLIDSIGLGYEVGAGKVFSAKLLKDSGEKIDEAKTAVFNQSKIRFQVESKTPTDGLWQAIGSKVAQQFSESEKPDLNVSAEIIDDSGNIVKELSASATYDGKSLSNTDSWSAITEDIPSDLKPGEYLLRINLLDEGGTTQSYEQNFLWGVLAFNSNKSQYESGETASFSVTVLDEIGATVCDADINMKIYDGELLAAELSTKNGKVVKGDSCELYGDQITPDYAASYNFETSETYRIAVSATSENGTYEIEDFIDVVESSDISIERIGPTRLYPVVDYQMTLIVTSSQDKTVVISDYVPDSFSVTQPHDSVGFVDSQDGDMRKLEWTLNLRANQKSEVSYLFDAPDVSPAFYNLGPAFVTEDDEIIFEEFRQWQLAGDAIGRMILLYDGATVPSGWTCISCTGGDPFYQTFIRGNATYGGTGGSATFTHTSTGTVTATTTPQTNENKGSGSIDTNPHTHTLVPTFDSPSSLPSYRQLKVIRSDTSGTPASLPAGVIGLFDGSLPSGWTAYSAQNGTYIYGENTAGTTGGSNTHSHTITGTTGAAAGTTVGVRGGGTQDLGASAGHTHTISASTLSDNHEPQYIETVLAKLSSAQTPPGDLIAMWDDTPPTGWSTVSGSSQPFNQKFIKPAATYGTTGGNTTHTHSDVNTTSSVASASTSARTGATGSDDSHTHSATVSAISNTSNDPPYRDVILAKKLAGSIYEQSSYRFFENQDSTNVGTALAAQDTAADISSSGGTARLRTSIHISNDNLTSSGQSFKLQYATRSGTCDTAFTGETYTDVSPSSGAIRYHNNTSPTDGTALTTNANDPVHSGHTTSAQTYEESNNFTNSQSTINSGNDGLWDFSLIDFSAPALTTYCFRIVESDGTLLDTYTQIPELTTADTPPKLILLYDGVSIPSGWTCISCNSGEDAYQRFLRGEGTYGVTGGNATHTPTVTSSFPASAAAAVGENRNGTGTIISSHTHTLTPTIAPASNLPSYRQLQVISYDSGTPTTIPAGAIALFTSGTAPSGWTRYSSQDSYYVRGENTIGTTGGSNTHNHAVSGTSSTPVGTAYAVRGGGTQVGLAADDHTHTISGNTDTLSNEPTFREVVLIQANSSTSLPSNMIAMWDKSPPTGWSCISCNSGDALYQTFIKGAATYGTTGGNTNHTHADQNITSSVPTTTTSGRTGAAAASDTHTHVLGLTNYSNDSHLPPYLDVLFASKGTNTAPNNPTGLDQIQVSTASSISVGGWAETQVQFNADASDTDNPDDLKICVEVEEVGTAFNDVATSCGTSSSYTGSAVTVSVTITGLTDGADYHWQAYIEDAQGAKSAWVSFGGNAETAADFSVDATAPSGTVYDGTTVGVDTDFNSGALDTLSANWSITDADSGISLFEYSIGTTPGGTDIKNWTGIGTSTSVTASSLVLQTSQLFYFNIRATDNAGNISTTSSDGQLVAPTLSFSTAPGIVQFGELNAGNSYTSTVATTLTTSTNAYRGYVVRAFTTGLLSSGLDTISFFDGGTYAAPDGWIGGDTGYGYTSSDTSIQGVNIFQPATCLGGNPSPCYAPFATVAPGDIIADHTALVSGTPVSNESFIITHRVTTTAAQKTGTYTSEVIYSVIPTY